MARNVFAKFVRFVKEGDGSYAAAADELIRLKVGKADGPTYKEAGESVGKSASWCQHLVTWRTTASPDTPVDWRRGSHGTLAEIREGAKKLLSSPKAVAALPAETKAAMAKAIAKDPVARQQVEHELQQQHAATRSNPTDVREPKFPLLHRIESDRVKLEAAAELMAGHWHDGRHNVGDEEDRLVRDSMAEAVINVEKTVTDALRTKERAEDRT